jgi:uncharacterized protein (DUF1330 family)
MDHGAEVLVADCDSAALEGTPGPATVVMKLASKESAKAWHESPQSQAVVHHRLDNTENGLGVLCKGFIPPA